MKIDLHNHTNLSSACSILEIEDLIYYSRERGLDGVCVTEHNTMHGGQVAEEIGREQNFLVIGAQEVSCAEGDVLAYGIMEEDLYGIPVHDLCELASETNAVLIPAHPYRTSALSLGKNIFTYAHCFTAIEGLNGNATTQQNDHAVQSAHKLGLPIIGGSDAHSSRMVAQYYTEFDDDLEIYDLPSLIEALKTERFTAKVNPEFYLIRR